MLKHTYQTQKLIVVSILWNTPFEEAAVELARVFGKWLLVQLPLLLHPWCFDLLSAKDLADEVLVPELCIICDRSLGLYSLLFYFMQHATNFISRHFVFF
mmetsp:Transcript_17373/g.25666  ORF Transcript_17373/g.25666 Transcript_17373/m.25666 type:complete len:100 (+) Transcript_17373:713-1012(+)